MPNGDSTYIAFDFGTKKIGVAVGQTVTSSATPLPILKAENGQPNWQRIAELIQQWQPKAFIVGLPLNMDESEQLITVMAKKFANRLHGRFGLPVYESDERLTTRAVKEMLFEQGGYKALQKQPIDSLAAKLILESWLLDLK